MHNHSFATLLAAGILFATPAFAHDHGNQDHDRGHHDNGKHGPHKHPTGAPPVAIREVRPANPYRNGVWTPGYYIWVPERDRYVWKVGMWVQPPRAQAVWTPARWQLKTDTWTLTIGHW